MTFKIILLSLIAIFYGFYFFKMITLKMKKINVNQVVKGKKDQYKTQNVELLMMITNVLEIISIVLSIILRNECSNIVVSIIGTVVAAIGVIFFALATITMKQNWRVGIPKERTSLVTNGVFKISRNPAFLGFDLLYIGVLIAFFNVPLFVTTSWAISALHFQIIQEEEHLQKVFGTSYTYYKNHTGRYLGKKKK